MSGLDEQPKLTLTEAGLLIELPEYFRTQDLSGAYNFYRPNDKSKDFKLPVGPDGEMKQLIPYEMLGTGKWRVKMNMTRDKKTYFKEEIVVI
jgi:nitrogen fixation protein FixH